MKLKQCIFYENDCYKKGTKIRKHFGILVHSTGANNPTLKRYVQPSTYDKNYDEIMKDVGKNRYGNSWNKSGGSSCVHAFIGKNDKGEVETYQVLPFDICCWGCGRGKNGSYNYNPTAKIQFEICEDDLTNEDYFNKVMKEAQEFCAYLCKTYNIGIDHITSHKESHALGYASNHGDPENWLSKFGKNMNWFRDCVNKILKESDDCVMNGCKYWDGSKCTKDENKSESLKVGDVVRLTSDAVVYNTNKRYSSWVYNADLYVRQINGNRIVVSTVKTGPVTGAVDKKYLIKKG